MLATRLRRALLWTGIFLLGFLLGAYLFSDTQRRPLVSVTDCHVKNLCLDQKQLLGLFSSVGMQKFPGVLPGIVMETEKTVAIKNPFPNAPVDYAVIPKKDITDIGQLGDGDRAYLDDAYAVMDRLIARDHLTNYKVVTNGPGYQDVSYLHFHLIAF